MNKRNDSSIVHIAPSQIAVATLLYGTSDSQFVLMRGVPSNSEQRIDEYIWTEVLVKGQPVYLTLTGDNPLTITTPGTYRFRNMGTEDEEALIDITLYNKE